MGIDMEFYAVKLALACDVSDRFPRDPPVHQQADQFYLRGAQFFVVFEKQTYGAQAKCVPQEKFGFQSRFFYSGRIEAPADGSEDVFYFHTSSDSRALACSLAATASIRSSRPPSMIFGRLCIVIPIR